MPFNERITNHRRLMRAALSRLTQMENDEKLLKLNPELHLERKIRLVSEYGSIMDELANTIYTDAGMPSVEPPNMVQLAEEFYKNKVGRFHNGSAKGLSRPSLKTFS